MRRDYHNADVYQITLAGGTVQSWQTRCAACGYVYPSRETRQEAEEDAIAHDYAENDPTKRTAL